MDEEHKHNFGKTGGCWCGALQCTGVHNSGKGSVIVHLECGHEFVIGKDEPSPSFFDCRYCSRVQTIEEKERDDRRRHEAESHWLGRANG